LTVIFKVLTLKYGDGFFIGLSLTRPSFAQSFVKGGKPTLKIPELADASSKAKTLKYKSAGGISLPQVRERTYNALSVVNRYQLINRGFYM